MKELEVVEYFFNAENRITGWKLHRESKRPDLIGVPFPNRAMNITLRDEYNRFVYELVGGAIVLTTDPPTPRNEAERYLDSVPTKKLLKTIMLGIATGETDPEYLALKQILIDYVNGERIKKIVSP